MNSNIEGCAMKLDPFRLLLIAAALGIWYKKTDCKVS